jgi:hypothetical protein
METSLFWTSNGTGDGGTAGYTQAQWVGWLRRMFQGDRTTQGYISGYRDGLAVTGSASPLNVGAGAAMVDGFPYELTAGTTIAVPTPVADTRIDRIVLRASYAAQTVRLSRVAGIEGGGTPALTQTENTTWEIPLAVISTNTGGAISVTDARVAINAPIVNQDAINAHIAGTEAIHGLTAGVSPIGTKGSITRVEGGMVTITATDGGRTSGSGTWENAFNSILYAVAFPYLASGEIEPRTSYYLTGYTTTGFTIEMSHDYSSSAAKFLVVGFGT